MKKSYQKDILQHINTGEEYGFLDFTQDTCIKITVKKIAPDFSFVLKFLTNFKMEMSTIEQDIAVIRNDGLKKDFLKKMKKVLLDSCLYQDARTPRKRERALKHSVTWYIYNRIDDEISKIEKRIEGWRGIIKATDNLDECISIIRRSKSPTDAIADLMRACNYTEYEAQYAVNAPIRSLGKTGKEELLNDIKYLNEVVVLLNDLKG